MANIERAKVLIQQAKSLIFPYEQYLDGVGRYWVYGLQHLSSLLNVIQIKRPEMKILAEKAKKLYNDFIASVLGEATDANMKLSPATTTSTEDYSSLASQMKSALVVAAERYQLFLPTAVAGGMSRSAWILAYDKVFGSPLGQVVPGDLSVLADRLMFAATQQNLWSQTDIEKILYSGDVARGITGIIDASEDWIVWSLFSGKPALTLGVDHLFGKIWANKCRSLVGAERSSCSSSLSQEINNLRKKLIEIQRELRSTTPSLPSNHGEVVIWQFGRQLLQTWPYAIPELLKIYVDVYGKGEDIPRKHASAMEWKSQIFKRWGWSTTDSPQPSTPPPTQPPPPGISCPSGWTGRFPNCVKPDGSRMICDLIWSCWQKPGNGEYMHAPNTCEAESLRLSGHVKVSDRLCYNVPCPPGYAKRPDGSCGPAQGGVNWGDVVSGFEWGRWGAWIALALMVGAYFFLFGNPFKRGPGRPRKEESRG